MLEIEKGVPRPSLLHPSPVSAWREAFSAPPGQLQQSLIEPDAMAFLPASPHSLAPPAPRPPRCSQFPRLLSLSQGNPENNLSCLVSADSYVIHNREESGILEDESKGRGEAEGGRAERKRAPAQVWGR